MGSIVTKIRNEGASHPLHPIVRHDMVDSAILRDFMGYTAEVASIDGAIRPSRIVSKSSRFRRSASSHSRSARRCSAASF